MASEARIQRGASDSSCFLLRLLQFLFSLADSALGSRFVSMFIHPFCAQGHNNDNNNDDDGNDYDDDDDDNNNNKINK